MATDEPIQSSRFFWKKKLKYDLLLLAEVNSRNPYAFNNQKPTWTDIASVLQEGDLEMRVTDRSCRERVTELLRIFRRGELASIRTSGASEEELSELKDLLFDVAKLESAKPTKQLKTLYCKKGRDDGEAIRKRALEGVENPFHREQIVEELELKEFMESVGEDSASASEKSQKRKVEEQDDLDDFEFGPTRGKSKSSKKDNLLLYLQNKSEREIDLRKQEFRVREKEAETKAKEIDMLRETKEKENEIVRMRTEAEIEDKKKIMDLLIKLATEKRQ